MHAMIDCTDPRRSARFRVGTVHAHPTTIMSTNCNSHPLCEPFYFVEGERVDVGGNGWTMNGKGLGGHKSRRAGTLFRVRG